jgi:hypothetical protein
MTTVLMRRVERYGLRQVGACQGELSQEVARIPQRTVRLQQ